VEGRAKLRRSSIKTADYNKNQQGDHKKESFQDEIKRLSGKNGIDMNRKWFWVDS